MKALCFLSAIFLFASDLWAIACKDRVAIAPPQARDLAYGDWLAEIASDFIVEKEGLDCMPFLNFEESSYYFDSVGYSTFFTVQPTALADKQIKLLHKNMAVSHLLFIRENPSKRILQLVLYKVDVDSDPATLKFMRRYKLKLKESEEKSRRSPTYLRFLSLLVPNAITKAFSATTIDLHFRNGYEEISVLSEDLRKLSGDSQVTLLDTLLSGFATSNIEHPDAYQTWDISLSLMPRIFLFALEKDERVSRDNGSSFEELRLRVRGGCANGNAQMTLHWPLGATYLSLGLGSCLLSTNQKNAYFDLANQFSGGHRVFVDQHMFAFFEYEILNFARPLYSSELATSSSLSRYSIGLGAYIPDSVRLFSQHWRTAFPGSSKK